MRKLTAVVGLAAVLAAAYWFDLQVLPQLRRAAGQTFDPAPAAWTEMLARLALALAVVGLGWLVFVWSPPSRLVGLAYLVVGAALVLAWPLVLAFRVEIPGFTALNLWLALGESGLLNLVAPFVVAIGLARLAFPVRRTWRRSRTTRPVAWHD